MTPISNSTVLSAYFVPTITTETAKLLIASLICRARTETFLVFAMNLEVASQPPMARGKTFGGAVQLAAQSVLPNLNPRLLSLHLFVPSRLSLKFFQDKFDLCRRLSLYLSSTSSSPFTSLFPTVNMHSAMLGSIARRGLDAHASFAMENPQYKMPMWGIALLTITAALYLFAQFMVSCRSPASITF